MAWAAAARTAWAAATPSARRPTPAAAPSSTRPTIPRMIMGAASVPAVWSAMRSRTTAIGAR